MSGARQRLRRQRVHMLCRSFAASAWLQAMVGSAGLAQMPDTVVVLAVPTAVIQAGGEIHGALLGARSFTRSSLPSVSTFASREEAAGKLARRTLLPGQPIPRDAIRGAPIVSSGQSVLLVYQAGPLRITADGVALAGAAAGEFVSVRTPRSGTVVRGRVASSREIVVEGEP